MAEGRKRPLRRARGMSLIETTIALVVLSVGILGMLAAQVVALQQNNDGRFRTEASQLARDQLEVLQRLPWTDPAIQPAGAWSAPRTTSTNVARATGTAVAAAQSFTTSWRVQAGATPNLRRVDVRVNWTENTQGGATANRQLVMSTLKVDE